MPLLFRLLPLVVLTGGAALATDQAPVFEEAEVWSGLLASLDTSGAGRVTVDEYARVADASRFGDLDANQDGAITVDELAAWVQVTPPRPERSALVGPQDEVPGSPPPVPGSPTAPPPTPNGALPAAGGVASPPSAAPKTTAQPPLSAAAPVPTVAAAEGPSTLQVVTAGVVGAGALSLLIGLLLRSRGGGRRRGRRR